MNIANLNDARAERGARFLARLLELCTPIGFPRQEFDQVDGAEVAPEGAAMLKEMLSMFGISHLDRRHFREVEPGIFEVWAAHQSKLADGRSKVVDVLAGHVIVQLLPTWLPRVRIDAKNAFSMAGWFDENYLPYRRPTATGQWPQCPSPFMKPIDRSH